MTIKSSFIRTTVKDVVHEPIHGTSWDPSTQEPIDTSNQCSYERTWFEKDGTISGKCRWSAPPPVEGEGSDDIKIFDEETCQMVPIPPGFTCPMLPNDDPEW